MKKSFAVLAVVSVLSLGMTGCNVIRGQSTAGEFVDDVAITTSVKADLLSSKKVDGLDVNVDSVNGNVTLRGWASNNAERSNATRIARSVKGVKSVDNQLKIKV
jgi:hyperosmotically inducible periplasmic protein